jgi:hypothetical protein
MVDRTYDPGQPCVADLSPVPFDRPAFPLTLPPAAKKGQKKPYSEQLFEDVSPAASGRVQFSRKTRQRVYRTDARASAKVLERGLRESGSAGAETEIPAKPHCRVEIVTPGGRTVEQLWAAGVPWPLYSASESARSWLVHFKRSTREG